MWSSVLQLTLFRWQARPLNTAPRAVASLQSAWRRAVRALQERAERVRRRHEWSAFDGLSPQTLNDIGAPDWLVLDAAERREQALRRLDGFNPWRGV